MERLPAPPPRSGPPLSRRHDLALDRAGLAPLIDLASRRLAGRAVAPHTGTKLVADALRLESSLECMKLAESEAVQTEPYLSGITNSSNLS